MLPRPAASDKAGKFKRSFIYAAGGSMSGAKGAGSGNPDSSTWEFRSAAFSIRAAAMAGSVVDLANLRSVAA